MYTKFTELKKSSSLVQKKIIFLFPLTFLKKKEGRKTGKISLFFNFFPLVIQDKNQTNSTCPKNMAIQILGLTQKLRSEGLAETLFFLGSY